MAIHLESVHYDGLTATHEVERAAWDLVAVADVAERVDAETKTPKGRRSTDIAVEHWQRLDLNLPASL